MRTIENKSLALCAVTSIVPGVDYVPVDFVLHVMTHTGYVRYRPDNQKGELQDVTRYIRESFPLGSQTTLRLLCLLSLYRLRGFTKPMRIHVMPTKYVSAANRLLVALACRDCQAFLAGGKWVERVFNGLASRQGDTHAAL